MLDHTIHQLDGPDFLEAVADAEAALGNEVNAHEYRARAQQWRRERTQRASHDECGPMPAPAPMPRRGCALPVHGITPSDRR